MQIRTQDKSITAPARLWTRVRKISFVALLCVIAVIAALYILVLYILRWSVPASDAVRLPVEGLARALGEIPTDAGRTLLYDDDEYSFHIITDTLNLVVTDKRSGRVWNGLPQNDSLPVFARSPMIIKFYGNDNSIYEWDASRYVLSGGTYSLYHIENGVQMCLDFVETENYRLNEFMPRQIMSDRYNELFIDAVEAGAAEGSIDGARAEQYLSALRTTYVYDSTNDSYYNRFAGLPPASTIMLLIELAQTVGYTSDMVVDDNAMFGITIEIMEPAAFTVWLEVTMEGGTLRMHVPVYETVTGNDFYILQNITLYPAFDSAFESENDGYIFVPDGSGMLFKMDTGSGKYPDYSRPVYDNTLYDTMYFKSDFDEDVHMPVYGMYKTKGVVTSGFFCVIENGAELSQINVRLRSRNTESDGALYNAVFSSFDTMQYSRVRIFGPYSEDDARYTVSTGLLPIDYTLRYFLVSKDADYFTFAGIYKEWLKENYGLTEQYDNREKIFVEMIGAVSVLDTFMGVSTDRNISMTSYVQAAQILDELADYNPVANYKYGFNNGRASTFPNGARTVPQNGSSRELKEFMSRNTDSSDIFWEADLMRVYKMNAYTEWAPFYLTGYDGARMGTVFYDWWYPDSTFYSPYMHGFYYLLHPRYLSFAMDSFLEDAQEYPNITLTDYGNRYYANYNPRDQIDPHLALHGYLLPQLDKIAAEKSLALDNPNADRIPYISYALNISRESSAYGLAYASVPFRQLVLSGLCEFTTLDVNGARSSADYFLLQALETGAIPKFTVCAEPVDVLIKARVSMYYAHVYDEQKNLITSLGGAYKNAFAKIGTKVITDHDLLRPGLTLTTYQNGVRVLCNYNLFEVTEGEYDLPAMGYAIIPAGEPLLLESEAING